MSVIPGLILKKETKNKVENNVLFRTVQRYNLPTSEQYNKLLKLIFLVNHELFSNKLPGIMISFSDKAGRCAKIISNNWQKVYNNQQHNCYEICLDSRITMRDNKEMLIAIIHALCHFLQIPDNTQTREHYNNQDFSNKMKNPGLITLCSDINSSERCNGQDITISTIKNDKFECFYNTLKEEDFLLWKMIASPNTNKHENKNKITYKCLKCNAQVWGKPGLNINCNNCNNAFKQIKK